MKNKLLLILILTTTSASAEALNAFNPNRWSAEQILTITRDCMDAAQGGSLGFSDNQTFSYCACMTDAMQEDMDLKIAAKKKDTNNKKLKTASEFCINRAVKAYK